MLGTATSFKHVHFLGGELPTAPEVHLPWACGYHSNRSVSHCTQPMVQPGQQISYCIHSKILQGIFKTENMKQVLTTYFGFFIAEFSRATRSSCSLTQNDAVSGSFEFITSNRIWNTFLIRKLRKDSFLFQSTYCLQQEMTGWFRICSAVGLFTGSCDTRRSQELHRKSPYCLACSTVSDMNPFVSYQPETTLFSDYSPYSRDLGSHTPVWSMQTNKHPSSLP